MILIIVSVIIAIVVVCFAVAVLTFSVIGVIRLSSYCKQKQSAAGPDREVHIEMEASNLMDPDSEFDDLPYPDPHLYDEVPLAHGVVEEESAV